MPARHHRSAARIARLEACAREMRFAPTLEEALLWQALKGRQLGVAFRRQALLLGRFIVDFYAPAARLVVEVDGGYHVLRRRADARRDRVLEQAGYRVLRIEARIVCRSLHEAVERVAATLGGLV